MRSNLLNSTALLFFIPLFHPIAALSSPNNSARTSPSSSCCYCPPSSTANSTVTASSDFPSRYPSASATSSDHNSTSNTTKTSWNYTTSLGSNVGSNLGSRPGQPQIPLPVLVPAVHWEIDTGDLERLKPGHEQELYYSEDGAAGDYLPIFLLFFSAQSELADQSTSHVFARVSANTSNPSVVLQHSAYINSIRPTSNGLRIAFNNPNALAYAEAAWSRAYPLVLVTVTERQRVFHLVTHFEAKKGENVMEAVVGEELPVEEAMPEMQIVWGTYAPSGIANTVAGSDVGPGSAPGSTGGGGYNSTYPTNGTTAFGGLGNSTSTNSTSGDKLERTCGAAPSPRIGGFESDVCGSSPTVATSGDGYVCSWKCERQAFAAFDPFDGGFSMPFLG